MMRWIINPWLRIISMLTHFQWTMNILDFLILFLTIIFGLQGDMVNLIERWINITLNTCQIHPSFALLEELLNNHDAFDVLNPSPNLSRKNSVDLVTSAIETFYDELKAMIRKYTAEDEVIYKRAVELYNLQSNWS
eukprot:scaffold1278_cov59-Cyclotella_meneghiniana.AAC.7